LTPLYRPSTFLRQVYNCHYLRQQTVGTIPASDRFVSRQDNEQIVSKIEDALTDLGKSIEDSNSVETELEEPKEAILGEIDASKALIGRKHFSLRKLVDLIVPLLRKLAEKFGSAAIGKLATELIEALMKL
jgi:hypothetical protein